METIVPPLVSAAVVATLLQLVKNAPMVPWISRETGRINAMISVALAGLTALGLSYSGNFHAETGTFAVTLTGSIGGLLDGGSHWLGQWAAQHAVYKGLIVPAEILGEVRAILKDALLHQRPQIKAEVPRTDTQGHLMDGP